jgi:hypothetical protein
VLIPAIELRSSDHSLKAGQGGLPPELVLLHQIPFKPCRYLSESEHRKGYAGQISADCLQRRILSDTHCRSCIFCRIVVANGDDVKIFPKALFNNTFGTDPPINAG